MSFKAKFSVDGKEFNVLSASYHLYQETDATGRPSSITRGGSITVTIESTDDTSMFAWIT
ncbi:MAG: type VI secretion system tube protein TssD, partial [Bacteroidetes bacterium]|nr:type VI secretion system tube protein TssD [Bacteroidota bacterium]